MKIDNSEYNEPMKDIPFKALQRKKSIGTIFENIKITKGGKTFDLYDYIQEGREDTEIYPTLEKYGCLDRMTLDAKGIYTDLTDKKDLRSSIEQIELSNKLWLQLPAEVRQIFNNDKKEFAENGESWLKNQIDLHTQQSQQNQPTETQNQKQEDK